MKAVVYYCFFCGGAQLAEPQKNSGGTIWGILIVSQPEFSLMDIWL